MTPAAPVERAEHDTPVAVIGDIHGRSDLLRRLLAQLPDVPVYVLGDVGDRGPDTKGVIETLVRIKARGVRGNHDEWLTAWACGEEFDSFALHPAMGGSATLASYGVEGRRPREILAQHHRVPSTHRDWLESLPVVLDLVVMGERYWLVHAGIPSTEPLPGLALEEVVPHLARTIPASLLWAKNEPEEMLPVDRPVVMGHLRMRRPLDTGNVIAIDTGAGTDPMGALTAVLLPERRFVSVR